MKEEQLYEEQLYEVLMNNLWHSLRTLRIAHTDCAYCIDQYPMNTMSQKLEEIQMTIHEFSEQLKDKLGD